MCSNVTYKDNNTADCFQLEARMGLINEQADPEQEIEARALDVPVPEPVIPTSHPVDEDISITDKDDEEEPLLEPLMRSNEDPDFASCLKVPWFLEQADPESSTAKQLLWRSKRSVVLHAVTILSTFVWLINVIVLFVLHRTFPGGALLRGTRETTSALNTVIHVVVNVISTVLLCCSNLCMQLLVAPTRDDVNVAHAKKIPVSLEIGIPSFRNLRFIGVKRALLWIMLGAASLPIHLLYNSVSFSTQPLNSYTYLVVQPSFFRGDTINMTVVSENALQRQMSSMPGYSPDSPKFGNWSLNPDWVVSQLSYSELCGENCNRFRNGSTLVGPLFANITAMECLSRYSTSFGNQSDVIIVVTYDELTSGQVDDGPLMHVGYSTGPTLTGGNTWLWGSSNKFSRHDLHKASSNDTASKGWNVFGYRVDYCLSRQWDNSQASALGFSAVMLTAVCIANFLKVVGIAWTCIIYSKSDIQPLNTLGDALASFLRSNDSHTEPYSRFNLSRTKKRTSLKLYQTQSRYRWGCLFSSLLVLICIGCWALYASLRTIRQLTGSSSMFLSLGFGKPSEYALSVFAGGNFGQTLAQKFYNFVIFANIWQLVLSMIYFQYNGVLTAMLVAREWTRYMDRKSLRVTYPEATTQRTSYSVSMPWRFGAPLLAASAALHWLLSQSIFIVPLEEIDKVIPEKLLSNTLNTVNGFSVWPIIIAIIFGILICVPLCIYGYKPFEAPFWQGRPTDSIVISSACHQPQPYDRDARFFQVQYGFVPAKFYPERAGQGREAAVDHSPTPNRASTPITELCRVPAWSNYSAKNIESGDVDGYLTFTTYRNVRSLADLSNSPAT